MLRDRTAYQSPKEPNSFLIQKTDRLLFLGSCFAENIGRKLEGEPFAHLVNPLGITFNPAGITRQVNYALNRRSPESLNQLSGRKWVNLEYHSEIQAYGEAELNERITERNDRLRTWMDAPGRKIGILTAGTAWTWMHENRLINNCHKLPANQFERRLLEIAEIEEGLHELMQRMPEVEHWILTVSPVRHLRQGFEGNMRSKARLIEAFQSVAEETDDVVYFPAYEIFMDDLRDYRWTDRDLVHPSGEAVDYIFDHFTERFFDPELRQFLNDWMNYRQFAAHRPQSEHPEDLKEYEERKKAMWERVVKGG
jgi:hypothetical protein